MGNTWWAPDGIDAALSREVLDAPAPTPIPSLDMYMSTPAVGGLVPLALAAPAGLPPLDTHAATVALVLSGTPIMREIRAASLNTIITVQKRVAEGVHVEDEHVEAAELLAAQLEHLKAISDGETGGRPEMMDYGGEGGWRGGRGRGEASERGRGRSETRRRRRGSDSLPRTAAVEATAAETAAPQPAAALLPAAAIALTLAELAAATGGFGEQNLIGSGGNGRVFAADTLPSLPPEVLPPRLRHLRFAVKRVNSGAHNLATLQREVSVLQRCKHPHVLPLLGYCLELESLCLVFPLMRGGSFANRLWPSKADPKHMRRLGLSAQLLPLQWRERLIVLRQATDALHYLHTDMSMFGGKGSVLHRDFKPENILLDDDGNAFLADTGFAKMESGPEMSKQKSASHVYLTMGYLDPSIVAGGEYSATTDGWALGITMLVALTSRSPRNIFRECEKQFDDDFETINAKGLADAEAGWPPHVATAVKNLIRSAQRGLCHTSDRRKLAVAEALATLTRLADEGESGSSGSSAVESPAVSSSSGTRSKAPLSSGQPYEPTQLSMQVRETRKGGDAQKRIQDNTLLAFSHLMPQFSAVYAIRATGKVPDGFEERINYWHRECGMSSEHRAWLHKLRVWANAARHPDAERWRRVGPRNEAEASHLVASLRRALDKIR